MAVKANEDHRPLRSRIIPTPLRGLKLGEAPGDRGRHEPDLVPDPHVRQFPLGDEFVDARLANPELPRHLRHRQQAVGAPEYQQQTSSKTSAKWNVSPATLPSPMAPIGRACWSPRPERRGNQPPLDRHQLRLQSRNHGMAWDLSEIGR